MSLMHSNRTDSAVAPPWRKDPASLRQPRTPLGEWRWHCAAEITDCLPSTDRPAAVGPGRPRRAAPRGIRRSRPRIVPRQRGPAATIEKEVEVAGLHSVRVLRLTASVDQTRIRGDGCQIAYSLVNGEDRVRRLIRERHGFRFGTGGVSPQIPNCYGWRRSPEARRRGGDQTAALDPGSVDAWRTALIRVRSALTRKSDASAKTRGAAKPR